MEQTYPMESVDQKQVPGPQMRRGYYGDDHELFRQTSSLDLKYPFPQTHLFPPSLSIRGGPLKAPGNYQMDGQQGQEIPTDPRYVPQDFVSLVRDLEDKRFKGQYGYPVALGNQQNNIIGGMNPANGNNLYQHAGGAGATTYNAMMIPAPTNPATPKPKENNGLVPQIPPLHVQQENSREEEPELNENSEGAIQSKCSRCKKDFVQRLAPPQKTGKGKSNEPKLFKLCFHCRDLQRQRSRRWQKKTKDKQGACRRCGSDIPVDQQRFVLCPECRKSLRIRKANRAAQGRCVHCSGPIAALIAKEDSPEGDSSEEPENHRQSGSGSYKVCQRCRENDKIRRTNLERMGNCNRCAKALTVEEQGKHKVCFSCRQKKKKLGSLPLYNSEGAGDAHVASLPLLNQTSQMNQGPHQAMHQIQSNQGMHIGNKVGQQPQGSSMGDMPQVVPTMSYVPMEQGAMLAHPGMNGGYGMPQQDMHMGYAQQMQPMMQNAGDMYKPPMAQLPQIQPQMDQGYQQYIGYPPVTRNGPHYSGNRM